MLNGACPGAPLFQHNRTDSASASSGKARIPAVSNFVICTGACMTRCNPAALFASAHFSPKAETARESPISANKKPYPSPFPSIRVIRGGTLFASHTTCNTKRFVSSLAALYERRRFSFGGHGPPLQIPCLSTRSSWNAISGGVAKMVSRLRRLITIALGEPDPSARRLSAVATAQYRPARSTEK